MNTHKKLTCTDDSGNITRHDFRDGRYPPQ